MGRLEEVQIRTVKPNFAKSRNIFILKQNVSQLKVVHAIFITLQTSGG